MSLALLVHDECLKSDIMGSYIRLSLRILFVGVTLCQHGPATLARACADDTMKLNDTPKRIENRWTIQSLNTQKLT